MVGTERGQLTVENEFVDFLKDFIDELEEDLIGAVNDEITEKELIQYKGFINVKGIFKNALDKFKQNYKAKSPATIEYFVNKNFKIGIESLERELDMNILGAKISTNKLNDMIQTTTFKESMLSDIKGLNEKIVDTVKKVVANGIINGLTLNQIRRNIQEEMKKFKGFGETMARTTSQDIVARGRHWTAKESGLKLRKYLSVHYDNRTSEICKHMGHEYGTIQDSIPMDEKFKYKEIEKLAPSFHFNCRTRCLYIRQEKYDREVKKV